MNGSEKKNPGGIEVSGSGPLRASSLALIHFDYISQYIILIV